MRYDFLKEYNEFKIPNYEYESAIQYNENLTPLSLEVENGYRFNVPTRLKALDEINVELQVSPSYEAFGEK